jgi:hypothetical protein
MGQLSQKSTLNDKIKMTLSTVHPCTFKSKKDVSLIQETSFLALITIPKLLESAGMNCA